MHLAKPTFTLAALATFLMSNPTTGAPFKRVEEAEFGRMPDGTVTKVFTLRNAKGMTAKVATYGALITEIQAPDRNGAMANVVLGADSLE